MRTYTFVKKVEFQFIRYNICVLVHCNGLDLVRVVCVCIYIYEHLFENHILVAEQNIAFGNKTNGTE